MDRHLHFTNFEYYRLFLTIWRAASFFRSSTMNSLVKEMPYTRHDLSVCRTWCLSWYVRKSSYFSLVLFLASHILNFRHMIYLVRARHSLDPEGNFMVRLLPRRSFQTHFASTTGNIDILVTV